MQRSPRLSLSLLLLATCFWTGLTAKELPTLEALAKVRQPERPGTPLWKPDGSGYAYRQSGSLWLFEKSTLKGEKLFDFKEIEKDAIDVPEPERFEFQNRRVRNQTLQWFPDNQRLLVVIKGDLFVWDIKAKTQVQLTRTNFEEADPKVSPDGSKVAYRHANELWVLDASGKGKPKQLTRDSTATRWNARLDWVYPEELDLGTAYWWAPDSRRIAYLQFDVSKQFVYPHADLTKVRAVAEPQFYPHAGTPNADVRLGVLDTEKAKTRWLLDVPGDTMLLWRVQWSPDGQNVAALRSTRVQDKLELLAIDPASGKNRVLLGEDSASWLNYSDDFRFLSNNQFLWASERTGFKHLEVYEFAATGAATRKNVLTSGEWLVQSVAGVDRKNGWVYYVSNEAHPIEKHLYRVKLDGSGKQRLSQGAGVFNIMMAPTADWYLEMGSSAKSPMSAALRNADGSELQKLWQSDPKVYDNFALPTSEIVDFKDEEGNRFFGRLVKPANFDPSRKYPAIVLVYGGPHAQSVTNTYPTPGWTDVLASKGFVLWEMDNRGTANRGLKWESALYRRFGKVELEDQLKGVAYLKKLGFVDPKRIGITGWSYGGFMTLYSMANAPDTFAAGIAGAPVTDWRLYDTIYTERYLGTPQRNEEGYKLSSPVSHAKQIKGDLLLIHCFEDDNVLFQNSMRMIVELQKAGLQFDLMLYPDKAHGVGFERIRHLRTKMINYFVEQLKPGE